MSESSEKPLSQEKRDQQLPEQDRPDKTPDPVGGSGTPEVSEPDQNGEKDFSTQENNNTEEYPSWLFDLESSAIIASAEVDRQDSDPDVTYLAQGNDSEETRAENIQEDLPEWLKQDLINKPELERQSRPEDEWPEWLKQGVKESSSTPGENEVSAQLSGAKEGALEPSQERPSEEKDRLNQETPAILPEADRNEPLAVVRLELKDAEQSITQEERPGLLTKMTGWLLASSQLKREPSETLTDDKSGAADIAPLEPLADEDLADVPPEISAELLASRLGEYSDVDQQDDEAIRRLESSIFTDEIDETQGEETGADELSTFTAEPEPETTGDEQPIDKELRREILSEIESSDQNQSAKLTQEGKRRKGLFGSLFGSKKADNSQGPAISDREIERRLLIGLSAASASESRPDESSSALQNETTDEVEPSSFLFQDEGTDSPVQTGNLDEEARPVEEEPFFPSEFEEAEDQPEGIESLPIESEQSITEEEPARVNGEVGYTELRELALHDYDESPQQPEGGPFSIFIQKIIHQIEDLSPLQKITVAFLFIVDVGFMVLLAAILTFSNFTTSIAPPVAPPAPTVRIDAPFPTEVILPGGWSFNLKPGTLREGSWANQGAEWLQGTEITRWVALPWSKQLEAVVVTFGPDEQIELVMSNLDRLKYKVESVQEVPVAEVRELNRNTPSLLIILANKDSDTRVVVRGSLISDGEIK